MAPLYAVNGGEREHVTRNQSAEHPLHAPTVNRNASPPKEPRVWREQKERTRHYRRFHATETQQYWSAYPPSSQSPETTSSSLYEDSATTFSATGQLLPDPFVAHLGLQLEHLKLQAHSIAETYCNFGLLFHSSPRHVVWHPAIDEKIRRFARINFLAGAGYPLPDMVHVTGTLQHLVLQAETTLRRSAPPRGIQETLPLLRANLCLAERLVGEATPRLDMLRQAVEIFGRMRKILWAEGKCDWEQPRRFHERMRRYQAWTYALPMVCWLGFPESKAVGLGVGTG